MSTNMWKWNWNAICGVLGAFSVGFLTILVSAANRAPANTPSATTMIAATRTVEVRSPAVQRLPIPMFMPSATKTSDALRAPEYGTYGRAVDIPGVTTPEQPEDQVQSAPEPAVEENAPATPADDDAAEEQPSRSSTPDSQTLEPQSTNQDEPQAADVGSEQQAMVEDQGTDQPS